MLFGVFILSLSTILLSNVNQVKADQVCTWTCSSSSSFSSIVSSPSTSSEAACARFGPASNFVLPEYAPSKTLSIVFDTTGGMREDLVNLRLAATSIVNKFLGYKSNPIEDYVLSLFKDGNDSGYEVKRTKDPQEFLRWLREITAVGGDDCPANSLLGLINALELSRPNSIAFVFTDGDARDHPLADEVFKLVQKSQTIVNFLITGNCQWQGADPRPRQVYFDIAEFSGGSVFDLPKFEVGRLLLGLSYQLQREFVTIEALELSATDRLRENIFKVDSSVTRLTISTTGRQSLINVKKLERSGWSEVDFRNSFVAENEMIITLNATGGTYKLLTNAVNDYSIRIGGMAKLSIDFGFSLDLASNITQTSYEPWCNRKNFLSIFVRNHKLIKCIHKITLIPLSLGERDVHVEKVELPFMRRDGHIYTTQKVTLPSTGFKIRVAGFDEKGNEFERTISTGILGKYNFNHIIMVKL